MFFYAQNKFDINTFVCYNETSINTKIKGGFWHMEITNDINIYKVRGKDVMLDSDLAKIYGYKNGTKTLNQFVKRNIELFNDNNYFQLTNEEILNLKSQFGTSSYQIRNLKFQNGTSIFQNYGGLRKLPNVFTIEGIRILNSVIRKANKEEIYEKIIKKFKEKETETSLIIPGNKGKITDLIYEVRGVQVMLDSDLAHLYECKNGTKTINLAVKRHPNRFPENFYFQLTESEIKNLNLCSRFQFETLNKNNRGSNIKYLPYVFTEEGVAMLSSVIKTPIADKVNVEIMSAFVLMRKFISNNLIEQKYINNLVFKHDTEIKLLQESFEEFEKKKKKYRNIF